MRKKLVLINYCNGLYGGVESFLVNIFNYLNHEEFEVTFLTCGTSTYGMFRDDIVARGGYIDEIPIFAKTMTEKRMLYKELRKYFHKNKPDIVHINSGGLSFHLLAAKAAKDENIASIILHSHNFIPSRNDIKEFAKKFGKNRLKNYGTLYLACSRGAAEWIFPKDFVKQNKVEIIPNGIDTKKFAFDIEKRKDFRAGLGLGEELVIGHIGRFQAQKNHRFLIRSMAEVVKTVPEAKLLLAGRGELQSDIEKYIDEQNLSKNVIFLGERRDMDAFLSAIDVFVLPSLYEGFGIAAIEAQAAGVKVLLADTIPRETNVTGRVTYLPIHNNKDEKMWAKNICACNCLVDRTLGSAEVANAGYDVRNYCNRMQEIYRGV